MAYSTTTSSSKPTSSVTFLAIHGRMTLRFTFLRSTFLSNSGGNFMDFNNFNSLSEKRRSWSAEVPLKNPASAITSDQSWLRID